MDDDLKLLQRLADCGGMGAKFLEIVRNAERYRWLRAQHWYEAELCVVSNPKIAVKPGHNCPSLSRLDDQIDTAMLTQTRKAKS